MTTSEKRLTIPVVEHFGEMVKVSEMFESKGCRAAIIAGRMWTSEALGSEENFKNWSSSQILVKRASKVEALNPNNRIG